VYSTHAICDKFEDFSPNEEHELKKACFKDVHAEAGIEEDSPVSYCGDVENGCEGSKLTAEVGEEAEGGYLEVWIEQWSVDGEEEEGEGEMSGDSQYTSDEVTDDEDEDESDDEGGDDEEAND